MAKKLTKVCNFYRPLTHAEAAKALRQVKRNPEVCDGCGIKPCRLAVYIWGNDKMR